METAEVIVARLVLGYLKEEKCRTAYHEFFKTSKHLQSDLPTRTKYLPTRFIGLTLTDILSEYFEISRIVQGRLESTNYYNECHIRKSLVHQLLYLLNKVNSSRTSTPCPRSPIDSNLDETSPSHNDHVSDVDTTPAHTLPGNVRCTSEDSYLHKTPRKKVNVKLSKSATVSNLPISMAKSDVLAHTLLENTELHEKIAQTINKCTEMQAGKDSSELDRTIKTIIQETEADPIFDEILEEIIGSSASLENGKGMESSSTASSVAKNSRDDTRNKVRRSKRRSSLLHSEDQVNECLAYTDRVEEQNDEAIRSIVAHASVQSNIQPTVGQTVSLNNEVTVFNGSLDKYLISNTCNANTQTQPVDHPVYINTNASLLMLPSAITPGGNLQLDATKQYYLVNKQPAVNWNMPAVQPTNILTEQDILAMPTVIVSEEKQSKPAPAPEPVKRSAARTLIPKPQLGIPAEYFYTATQAPKQGGLKNVVYPKSEETVKTAPTETVTLTESNPSTVPEARKTLPEDLCDSEEEPLKKIANTAHSDNKTSKEESTPTKECVVQKAPRSGSHVRNLDFSSPPKITSTHKKSARPKTERNAGCKSPSLVHKKQAAKTLFGARSSDHDSDGKSSGERSLRTWDADLRASLAITEEPPQSKKRKVTDGVNTKRAKSKARKKLNTTGNQVAAIEAALKTPVKSNADSDEVDKGAKTESVVSNSEVNASDANNTDRDAEVNTNKKILSPTKLNANKRKFIDSCGAGDSAKPNEVIDKFITPETSKDNVQYPIKANRNINSLFETPLKNDVPPKTPGLPSPDTSITTPFTKMLEANLKGIDISSLPTPTIPITPSFPPFTPNVDLTSPYSNRPTDYSTTSSYYQPSDSEPNRSLEANIIELEKQPLQILAEVAAAKNADIDKKETSLVKVTTPTVDVRLKIFNGNVIGKKNLSLVKRNMASSSSSSSDSSSDTSNDQERDATWVDKSNETVIFNKKESDTPKRKYSLRNRNVTNQKGDTAKTKQNTSNSKTTSKAKVKSSTNPDLEKQAPVQTEKPVDVQKKNKEMEINTKEEEELKTTKDITLEQAELKKVLNEKRLRTLHKIKNENKSTARKPLPKSTSTKAAKGKFMKIKIVPNQTKNRRKTKSEQSPKKQTQKGTTRTKGDPGVQKSTQDEALQNKSKSEEKNKNNTSVSTVKVVEKIDKSASDIEAQNLIEGLKERGIHLVKNKPSPIKKTDGSGSEVDTEPNNETCPKHAEDTPLERSSSELETEFRETYDTKTFEEYECVVFDESKCISKTLETYDLKVLEKTFAGKVFIEELNEEVEIPLVVSPFYSLLEISSSVDRLQKKDAVSQKSKEANKKSEKLLSSGCAKKTETNVQSNPPLENDRANRSTTTSKDDRDVSEAPSKRRKLEKEDARVPEEKECKTLLQKINVDTFLNNIYGNNK